MEKYHFNWIVIAKCQASKHEPEFERIIAGFDLYVNAVDFLEMFPEENRTHMEIRQG